MSDTRPAGTPNSMRSIPLTLIVACSPKNGIGKGGGLPWRLKKEMAYFKKVTSQPAQPGAINAVVMGRNTWESIPPKFRPLAGRVNVVISRTGNVEALGIRKEADSHLFPSLNDAAKYLQGQLGNTSEANTSTLSRVFLIGGAQLYNQYIEESLGTLSTAKRQESAGFTLDRLLVTRIKSPTFDDCDTFLKEYRTAQQAAADHGGSTPGGEFVTKEVWTKADSAELLAWLGEGATDEVKQSVDQTEGEVQYEMQMWTRVAETSSENL